MVYRNLVVALQTRAPAAMIDYNCEGHALGFDPRDSSRSTLSSILSAV